MRQSDGSEILGPNDPRNLVIGIIHVSPNDDRQSVVNAITSQDQKGRDQIVLELPAQNKSFKNAVDFEGLHQMASELEAAVVLVLPGRSKIANLARKEGFTVYPSLDELASAEFPPLEPDGAPVEDEEMEHTMQFPVEIPHASAPSSPPPAAPVSEPEPVEQSAAPEVAPVAPAPPAEPEEDEEPTSPSIPVVSSAIVEPEQDEEATNPALVAVTPGRPVAAPSQQEAEDAASSQVATGTPDAQGSATTPTSYLPAVVPSGTGALVPSNSQLPVYYEPIEVPRQRSWRGLIITGVTVLVLIGLGVLFYRPILDLFFPPTATVTIVPSSQQLQHTYQITAVLGVPDPTKNQVDARALYADSQPQTQTVKATGQGHVAGKQAQGELTFYNTSTSQQTITAGTIVFDPNGLAVVNDQTVTLPALDTTTGLTGMTVPAHTVNTGNAQNIPAYDFNSQPCCNGTVYVTNMQSFTGGQDQRSFTYVQQSDIDGVVQSMGTAQVQQATTALEGQIRANEKSAGAPHCAPQVSSDHEAGDQATSVTVNVTTSCVGEVYDMQAVQVMASRKLSQDAASNPGPAYAPVGNILTQVTQATPDAHGNVLLVTNATGIWAYQFTTAQRTHFANLITGKSQQDARSLLLAQTGVQGVTITLTGVGVTTIPGNPERITINVEAVPGLHP